MADSIGKIKQSYGVVDKNGEKSEKLGTEKLDSMNKNDKVKEDHKARRNYSTKNRDYTEAKASKIKLIKRLKKHLKRKLDALNENDNEDSSDDEMFTKLLDYHKAKQSKRKRKEKENLVTRTVLLSDNIADCGDDVICIDDVEKPTERSKVRQESPDLDIPLSEIVKQILKPKARATELANKSNLTNSNSEIESPIKTPDFLMSPEIEPSNSKTNIAMETFDDEAYASTEIHESVSNNAAGCQKPPSPEELKTIVTGMS